MRKYVAIAFCMMLSLGLVYWSYSQQETLSEKAMQGRALFYDASLGGSISPDDATGLTCANCHADFDEMAYSDGLIRSGHSVIGVPKRGTAKGGMIKGEAFQRSAGGSGFCAAHFLQRIPADEVDPTKSLTPEQAQAFMAYFAEISGGKEGPQFTMHMPSKEEAQKAGEQIAKLDGDAERGWQLFNSACNVCHLTGKKRSIGPALITRRPPDEEYEARIGRYVRGGGRLMPPFGEDRLSDEDVADIVAFVVSLSRR